MSNPIRNLMKQTAVYGLSSIVGRLLNYLLVPLYTSVFINPSDYGVVSDLYAWVAFLLVFLTFGMETAYFRFIQDAENKEKLFQNALFTVLGFNVIFFSIILYFNNPIASFMLYDDHNEYIILLMAIVCIDSISALPLAKLRYEEKAKNFVFIQFTSITINILLNLIFFLKLFKGIYLLELIFPVFDSEHPEDGVLMILLFNLISSVVRPLMLYKHFLKLRLTFDWRLAKTMVLYALPLVIAGFAGIVNETLDRILLKQILYDPGIPGSLDAAEAQVGIYSACYKLAMLVTILLQAYRYAAEPFFFSQMKNEDRNKVYVKVMNIFIALVCSVFLLVSLNIDIFKHFIRNEIYWQGLKVVPILLLANVFLGIYYNQSIWYKLSGKTKFGAYITIGGALITVAVNLIFIPTYGYMASAWATLLVYFLQMVFSYLLGQRHFPIPYNLKKFFVYIGLALVLYFIGSKIETTSFALQFVFQNSFILFYLAFIFFLERKTLRI